jgi:hypothetical protein
MGREKYFGMAGRGKEGKWKVGIMGGWKSGIME